MVVNGQRLQVLGPFNCTHSTFANTVIEIARISAVYWAIQGCLRAISNAVYLRVMSAQQSF